MALMIILGLQKMGLHDQKKIFKDSHSIAEQLKAGTSIPEPLSP